MALREDGSVDVVNTVSDMFSHAGEKPASHQLKPHIGYCTRLGRKSGVRSRPIKVCLSSGDAVLCLHKCGKKFWRNSNYQKCICGTGQDAGGETGAEEVIVELMKEKKKRNPERHYFIT